MIYWEISKAVYWKVKRSTKQASLFFFFFKEELRLIRNGENGSDFWIQESSQKESQTCMQYKCKVEIISQKLVYCLMYGDWSAFITD